MPCNGFWAGDWDLGTKRKLIFNSGELYCTTLYRSFDDRVQSMIDASPVPHPHRKTRNKKAGGGGGREEGRERINLELYWNNGEREIGRGRKKNWKTTWFSGGTRGARKHEGKKMFVELKSGKMERGERNCRKGQMDAARFE